jgi:hypothetical protein
VAVACNPKLSIMITVITDRREIERLQRRFQTQLQRHFTEPFNCRIGFHGGSWSGGVQYSPEFDLWVAEQQLENRYWNGFGSGRPKDSNSISGEINFPYEGINRRIAGVFALEDNENILVLHRGKIGGGKPGIGKNFFNDNFRGDAVTAIDGDKETQFWLVGELSSSFFSRQVANFIYEIRRIKNLEETVTFPLIDDLNNFQFTEEASGQTTVDRHGETIINKTHGIVVNALAEQLETRGFQTGNDRNRDLFIHERGQITTLFEIKTSSTTQCLYSAVGQLLIYSIPIRRAVHLIMVLPDRLNRTVEARLEELGISVLYYSWDDDEPVFIDIEVHL